MTPTPALLDAAEAPLVTAARRGDEASFDVLYRAHVGTVTSICRRRLPASEVDDAVQEAFLRAWRRLDTLDDPAAFGAWVRSIAIRVCVDVLRRSGRLVPMAEPPAPADPRPLPDEVAVLREDTSRVTAGLARLGDRDRRALWLRDALDWPIPDVAAEMGTTEGSTRVLLARARRRLRAAVVAVLGWLVGARIALRDHLRTAELVPASTGLLAAQLVIGLSLPVPPPSDGASTTPPAPSLAVPVRSPERAVATTEASPIPVPAPATTVAPAPTPSTAATTPPEPAATQGGDAEPPGAVTVTSRPADPDDPAPLRVSAEDDAGPVVGLKVFLGEVLDPAGDDAGPAEPDNEAAELDSPSGVLPVCLIDCSG